MKFIIFLTLITLCFSTSLVDFFRAEFDLITRDLNVTSDCDFIASKNADLVILLNRILSTMSSTSSSPKSSPYFSLFTCKSLGTIYNEQGEVIKGVCELNSASTYDEASRRCNSVGMELFVAENEEIYKSFIEIFTKRYKFFTPNIWKDFQGLWINGRVNNGEWKMTKGMMDMPMNTSFYKFTEASLEGDCMAVKNNDGFKVASFECAVAYSPVCEFY